MVAGDLDALEEFSAAHGERVRIRRVAIDYAAHTPHIEALRDELAEVLAGITPQPTEIDVLLVAARGIPSTSAS